MKRLIALAFVAACAAICLSIAAPSARAAAVVPACTQWGGYPWVNGGCLNGQDINNAFSFNPSALPPQNLFGQGALYGKLWLDTSTTPATLRECLISPNCSASYISSQWAVWGTLSSSGWTPVGGGGGTPGGTSGQVQYNNNGLFAGATVGTGLNLSGGALSATIAAADPTATAGPNAVNGTATTFMRSDAAPAVQKGSNAQFGIVEGDGTTISCVAGVCSAIGGTPPGGATNSIQYNNGGAFGGLGPLTDGQLLIGSTGNAAVPANLTAGNGVAINNSSGHVTISADGGSVTTKLSSGKAVSVAAGATQTLAAISGRGHIKRIWFSSANSGDPNSVLTSTFTITRDSEGTPSIALQDQDLFDRRGLPGWMYYQSQNYACRGVDSATGHIGAPCYIQINIPYDSSIAVTWTNSSATSPATIWYEIEYADDDANADRGIREHLHAAKVSTNVAAYAEQTLLDVAGPAMFVGLAGQWRGGDGNFNYQEGQIKAYIDNEVTASYQSSGLEDFFQQSDYARTAGPGSNIAFNAFGVPYSDATATISYYRWLFDDPVYGAAHLKVTWTNGVAAVNPVTNPTAIDLVVWYYTAS